MTDADYERFDPYSDDRGPEVRMRQVKVVAVRESQTCFRLTNGKAHILKPGTRARFEKGIIDGRWGGFWTCLGCIDEWIGAHE